jgi:hypothetical protein
MERRAAMKFDMTRSVFKSVEQFDEDTAPGWLATSDEFQWFYEGHVLTLDIGESVETDSRKITRIE